MDGKTISKLPKVRVFRINGEYYLAPRKWTMHDVRAWYERVERVDVDELGFVSFYEKVSPKGRKDFAQVIEATEFTLDDLPMQLMV